MMRESLVKPLQFVSIMLYVLVGGVMWGTWLSLARTMTGYDAATFLADGKHMISNLATVMEVLMIVWMFATSVVYPLNLQGPWGWLLALNPMTPIIDAYRQVLLHGTPPDFVGFGYAAVVAALAFCFGLRWFHESEYLFAERI